MGLSVHLISLFFDKKLLLDGKSIKQEKGRIKEKKEGEGKGAKRII
jgi:hypothetical protein